MSSDSDEHLVDVHEIAAYLNVHPNSIYRHAVDVRSRTPRRDEIPGTKVGREWRFLKSAVHDHLTKPADEWAYPVQARRKTRSRAA